MSPAAKTSSTVLVAIIIFLGYSSVVIHCKTEASRASEGNESLVNQQLELVVTKSDFVAAAITCPSSGAFSQGMLIRLVQQMINSLSTKFHRSCRDEAAGLRIPV